MSDLIRDAPLGQLIRLVTRNRYLKYPEERPDFQCPDCYSHPDKRLDSAITDAFSPEVEPTQEEVEKPEEAEDPEKQRSDSSDDDTVDLEKSRTTDTTRSQRANLRRARTASSNRSAQTQLEHVITGTAAQRIITYADLERQFSIASLEKGPSRPIEPTHLDDGTILVDWYLTDDQENPQNWSAKKKAFVALQICLYTLAVYMGSAIYTPSELGVMRAFNVTLQDAFLGLSMYVLAYGIGPLLWSPLSEIPSIGRNPPYLITFGIFVVLIVPTALAPNFDTLIAMRFLLGWFGSPCLATGGASLGDMYSLIHLPYVLCMWALAATSGPALGPLISGFSVAAKNWRWSQWEMLWLAGPIWILLFLCLPETNPSTVLLRRAARLRKATGNKNLKSQSEIDQAHLSPREIIVDALWRPLQLILQDPSIAFTALYIALVYAIFYTFFESFPLVYERMYGFNVGQMGISFLSITVGVIIAISSYWSYLYFYATPRLLTKGLGLPEQRLLPALLACVLCPIGLFMFAWLARPSIHWIAPTIGVGIFTIGVFLVIQCIFLYLPLSYPQYAASLFAGNDFARSTLAAGAVHFATPMFDGLGVDGGVSLLAGLTLVCCVGVWALWWWGPQLRARSRFAAK
ncbi:uncharacterized protein K452DRAFT_225726 [Aplosporella prunicola CBS 121167]|uniref:Major facilitator superfamily (MFS) profile domain-containing protein n=1 Tax=Aplosporella prunicola CBS 121167 TaxID=1176127 RepID=A0A6A6BFY4_9PEZI|nr:uncharacterized protein K452DRAFT_225726 [Aplosporella prunicola CBS 121167]KAF2143070.1 hypothetical protein K452DRAFT_225726 [Aplosporella prunicola CBS 121167]